MNRDKARELLPIIQAYVKGKAIQIAYIEDIWTDTPVLHFDSNILYYRIKPVPEVIWVNKYRNEQPRAHNSREDAIRNASEDAEYTAKKFIAADESGE